jgi:cytidylate kinase
MTLVAIDGPSGSGKSTVSRMLAKRLGCARLDTGAMYRAVALAALKQGLDLEDEAALERLASSIRLTMGEEVLLNGENVEKAIRTPEVDRAVSRVAAVPGVRKEMVARQQAWIREHGGSGVVEGRDIGTVVAPEADLKIYLDANPTERARRRIKEHHGEDPEEVAEDLAERDARDLQRSASPLERASDAIVVDTTARAVDSVVEEILSYLGTGDLWRPSVPYRMARGIAVGIAKAWFHPIVKGAEHLPARGPFLITPVHRSFADFLIAAIPARGLRVSYMTKEEMWHYPGLGMVIEHMGGFPVKREVADRAALGSAQAVLEAGGVLVLFPEGTRRSGREVRDLKDGAAFLSLRTGAPLVPVGIAGSDLAMPKGSHLPKRQRVVIVVGEPLLPPPRATKGSLGSTRRVSLRQTKELTEALRVRLQVAYDEALSILAAHQESSQR